MNLFQLRYFVTLAKMQHYTKAAHELCITQPSLSHAISQLEAELGVALFEKSGRNTTLTSFWEEFLICANRTLATLDSGVSSLQRIARGDGLIRLGMLRSLGVSFIPQLAARYLASHPEHDVRFTFHTGSTGDLVNGLSARDYDLIFCSMPPETESLDTVPITHEDLVLIVPGHHPLAAKQSVALTETLIYPQIYFSHGSGMRDVVDHLFSQINAVPQIAYETEEAEVIAGLTAQGFGIAVVPYMDLLLKLDVKILQISAPVWERNLYMIHDRQAFMPPAVRNFCEFVLKECEYPIIPD